MKITTVDSAVLKIPTRKPIALDFPNHSLVVAHIHTDEGITGLGYTLPFVGGGGESIQPYLRTRLAPLLTGQDPLMVERLWERMYRADRGIKRQGVAAYALSALDIALWDIVGKAAGLPLYKLWGAVTDRVPAYGSGGPPATAPGALLRGRGGAAAPRVGGGRRSELHAGGSDRGGAVLRRARLPLLQNEDPRPRSASESRAGGRGQAGGRRRRAHDGRRQSEARRAGQPSAGTPARGPRSGVVRGAGAGRRSGRVRGGGPRHQHPGRDRREQLHALRVPRSHRSPRRPLPEPRHLSGQRLQRAPQDRPPRRRPPGRGLAPRGARAIAAGVGSDQQRLPGRVDRLGAGGSLHRDAGDGQGGLPRPQPSRARHEPGRRR